MQNVDSCGPDSKEGLPEPVQDGRYGRLGSAAEESAVGVGVLCALVSITLYAFDTDCWRRLVGLATAHRLDHNHRRTVRSSRRSRGSGSTRAHNSAARWAFILAGIGQVRLAVEAFVDGGPCRAGIPHEICGKLVVAVELEELPCLTNSCGAARPTAWAAETGCRRMRRIEPHANGRRGPRARRGLWTTGPFAIDLPCEFRSAAGGCHQCGVLRFESRGVGDAYDRGRVQRGLSDQLRGLHCGSCCRVGRRATQCGLFRSGRVSQTEGGAPAPGAASFILCRSKFCQVHFTRLIHGDRGGSNAVLPARARVIG